MFAGLIAKCPMPVDIEYRQALKYLFELYFIHKKPTTGANQLISLRIMG